jgi:ATP-dependent Zn protease
MPSDSEVSMNKIEILSQIDVAMGGHVAEKLIVGGD